MSRDTHSGLRCPHCQTALALVPAADNPAASVLSVPIRDETPPPVHEVLAVYAGRTRDAAVAMRGAARVRESFNRARRAAARRRAAQRAAQQRPVRSA
ncbi:hypothetical protein Arub01_43530 [Actinomadura rubrobrunea]|uniref:Uncharacterized protein n=1 Tax=Actinomadura rubrobrunea TaxID=115335 RepID=A0A9W6UWF3_9ACTN|nr:hypothetical protein [Actinomadura rubrobrunea]GLW66109.1 hypothetical protein Arub01_43530 [Actinomadura rubrobrunea]